MKTRLLLLLTLFPAGWLAAADLSLRAEGDTLQVFRAGETKPILTQNAKADQRPFLHPLTAPGSQTPLTTVTGSETGLFWSFPNLNGRDYAAHPEGAYWKRVSAKPTVTGGPTVQWETVYHLLDAKNQPLMTETQRWSMREAPNNRYQLDVEWTGEALAPITGEKGGLFLRPAFKTGQEGGGIFNSIRLKEDRANGERSVWLSVSQKPAGAAETAHVAIFDHPKNEGFPQPWRVEKELAAGPTRGTWKLDKGAKTVIRHRIEIFNGKLNDVTVGENWSQYSGMSRNVEWGLAQAQGRTAKFLTGEQAIEKMTYPDAFEVKLFASEPAITQPMAFCWDDKGRIWVAENRDYETRQSGFSADGNSRILILEDTNGDGKMDTRKVFLEGIPFPAAIAWGFDGLWLGAPPHLLFVPDRNQDDKADEDKIEVRLTGWGIKDRHETLNSLHWGPDGWLYGCQGLFTSSAVGKPKGEARIYKKGEPFPENVAVEDPQPIDGGVWRYHPVKQRFEVVAHGFSNPWGVDYDDHGQLFITACVIPHLWYVIPGGVYHRQGGQHISPYVYDDIKTIVDHQHRSAHGGARIYLADAFPKEYHGRMFMANIHEHAVLTDILEPVGSGFVAHHGDDFLLANDPQWVGFSVEIGPEGAVYVLDWHDGDICGKEVLYKDTGRIFRIAPKGLASKTGLGLAKLSDAELVKLQLDVNDWYVRRARVLLHSRAVAGRLDPAVHPALWKMFEEATTDGKRLRALWSLHVTGGVSAAQLVKLLDHPSPYLRGWAIQLLCEDKAPADDALAKFVQLARTDPSPVVRLYLASALQRMAPEKRWPIASSLLTHGEDAKDHNLPKMIWFGVEGLVENSPAQALELATAGKIPLVRTFIARRAVAANKLDEVVAAVAGASDPVVRQELLQGMRDGIGPRRQVPMPKNWDALQASLMNTGNDSLRDLAMNLGQIFGSQDAAKFRLAILLDEKAAPNRRREALKSLAAEQNAAALPATIALLDQPAMRADAIRALASYDDPTVPEALLRRYKDWSAGDKLEAVQTLASRQNYAQELVQALKRETLPKRDVPAYVVRQLNRILGPSFVDYWGQVSELSGDKAAQLAKYKGLLTDEALAKANVSQGRAVFSRACLVCHKMYGEGGEIGPDITGSNRANLDYILENILNPSGEIGQGYQMVLITTRDGRTLAGTIASEDNQQVTLRVTGLAEKTSVAKPEIQSRETLPVSMMPEGLLGTLQEQEIRDLVAYLRTTQQVPLPQ